MYNYITLSYVICWVDTHHFHRKQCHSLLTKSVLKPNCYHKGGWVSTDIAPKVRIYMEMTGVRGKRWCEKFPWAISGHQYFTYSGRATYTVTADDIFRICGQWPKFSYPVFGLKVFFWCRNFGFYFKICVKIG